MVELQVLKILVQTMVGPQQVAVTAEYVINTFYVVKQLLEERQFHVAVLILLFIVAIQATLQ